MYYRSIYHSPIGVLTLIASDDSLLGLWMEGQKYHCAGFENCPLYMDDHPVLIRAGQWLDVYFSGAKPTAPPFPLCPRGSEFQETVWRALRQIPYGQTTTYGELTRVVGCRSAQAVGGAIAHNPISIIIPCHRVLGSNGSLTGYAGGEARKVWLLEHEGTSLQFRDFAGK